MPYAMSAGPATCAPVETTTIAIVIQSRARTGRSSDPSSRSERCRICLDSAFVKSLRSSPSTPMTLIGSPPLAGWVRFRW